MIKEKTRIVILGGGTAGWMTAAALSKYLSELDFQITLIESDEIGSIGVGEATIPHIREFNASLGINEQDFIQSVNATFKLGIRFKGWGNKNSDYFHPFGTQGFPVENIDFHHYWLRASERLEGIPYFDDFSFAYLAAKKGRFSPPIFDKKGILDSYSYAYHIDATAYANFLRRFSENNNVVRMEGRVTSVTKNPGNGDIESLRLIDGRDISANFFIDCSGFSSRILGKELGVQFDDWSHWLPCDSAFAVQSKSTRPQPYTLSTAKSAGWQWQIPLQNRVGNGFVFCSNFVSNDNARADFLKNIEEPVITEPRLINFTAGMRAQSWKNNCAAIGLSSGFLEPLESTSIYLIQYAIYKLLKVLSNESIHPATRNEFNKEINTEYKTIRDFLILHYNQNNRAGEPFWDYCRNMDIPQSLEEKINLFRTSGHIAEYDKGLFKQPSWLAVYLGQNLRPNRLHPLIYNKPHSEIEKVLEQQFTLLDTESSKLPSHIESIRGLKTGQMRSPDPKLSLYGNKN